MDEIVRNLKTQFEDVSDEALEVVIAFEKDLDDFRDSMPLIEYMTKEAMKIKDNNKKDVKYWREVFEECVDKEVWQQEVKSQTYFNLTIATLRDKWNLLDHLETI